MGLEVALIVGAVAAAASTGVSIHQAEQQRSQANRMAEQQRLAAEKQRTELETKERRDEATAGARADRVRQRARAGLAGGRRSTQLTGPLGLPDYASYSGPTLVGEAR